MIASDTQEKRSADDDDGFPWCVFMAIVIVVVPTTFILSLLVAQWLTSDIPEHVKRPQA
tara:strand:+ start:340 stop:516 length:177 start_codon:yes stop_codon:yes gene_type:complete